MKRFLRRSSDMYSKLGLRRKNKQKWRKPKGRDNKMREKRKGYPAVVSIGYKKNNDSRELINDKKPVKIVKPEEIEKLSKNEIAVIGRVGKKRRIEIAEKAKEKGIEIQNLNPKKFLKKTKKSAEKKGNTKNKTKQENKKQNIEKTKQNENNEETKQEDKK